MLRHSEPEFKPVLLIGLGEIPKSYRELSEIGFWQGSALSQFPVMEMDLEESTNPEK